jgi:3'(2'), 5'-bisphosphate nucleotidase
MKIEFELEALLPLVQEAGKAIIKVYEGEYSHTLKKGSSPVTEADIASHKIIIDGLRKIAPDIPVMSEEGEEIPYEERKKWEYYFLIDPLDGTKEFIEKKPEFTVNIALIQQNRPVMGIIHLPTERITYMAQKGQGAYRMNSKLQRLPVEEKRSDQVNIVISRRDSSETLKRILTCLPRFSILPMGSSLKFCLVAEGVSDFYPRTKPSMEWDTAAGAIIVEEAGGSVQKSNGEQILYNRENILNPPFYVFSKSFTEKVQNWKELLFSGSPVA